MQTEFSGPKANVWAWCELDNSGCWSEVGNQLIVCWGNSGDVPIEGRHNRCRGSRGFILCEDRSSNAGVEISTALVQKNGELRASIALCWSDGAQEGWQHAKFGGVYSSGLPWLSEGPAEAQQAPTNSRPPIRLLLGIR